MQGPAREPQFDTHCSHCGALVAVRSIKKRRVGVVSRHWQWDVDAVCSGCGSESGGTVSLVEFGSPSRNTRALRFLRILLGIPLVNRLRRRRHMPKYGRADGSPDVVKLVAAMPLPVYCCPQSPWAGGWFLFVQYEAVTLDHPIKPIVGEPASELGPQHTSIGVDFRFLNVDVV